MNGATTTSQLAKPWASPEIWRAYAAVVLASALVTATLYLLRGFGHTLPDVPPLLLPVLLGAFLGGLGVGLFAMIMGLTIDALLIRELDLAHPHLTELGLNPQLAFFLAEGLLLCVIGHFFRRSAKKTRDAVERQQTLEQEINRRRKLEEALLRSQRTIKAQLAEIEGIYATAPIGLAMVDREFRFTRVNRQWSQISGLKPDAHLGKTIQEVMPEFSEALVACIHKTRLSGEPIRNRQLHGAAPSGSAGEERIWLTSFVPLKESDGCDIGVNITIQDITEQKRFESALRESEEKYRQLTEWSPQCVWMTDSLGNPIYANRHWYEFTGLSLEEARDRGWLSIVHPDDRDRIAERYLRALQDGTRLETELRLRAKRDGEYRWHLLGALPLRGRLGMLSSWLVVAMDVHQIKSAEQALRETKTCLLLALEAGRMAVWEKSDPKGPLSWLDPINLRAAMDFEGPMSAWIEAIHLKPEEKENEASARSTPRASAYGAEFETASTDGERRWVEAHAQWFGEDDDARLVGILADVTGRKRAERALQEANRRKDEFLAVLAHELRNPLAPILSSAQLLRRRGLERPDLLESATGSIERQVKHLSRLIGDLSDISRIARGKLELKPEVLALDSIVSQALEVCRPIIDKHKQELLTHFPEKTLYVRGDPARLTQVICNLLVNASKFTSAGRSIHFTVTSDDEHVIISVRDEGIGIDPKALSGIFEPFVQIGRPLHSGSSGLGIGLALAKRLVEMQGGEISARSEGNGQGSEFVIRLPLLKANVSAA